MLEFHIIISNELLTVQRWKNNVRKSGSILRQNGYYHICRDKHLAKTKKEFVMEIQDVTCCLEDRERQGERETGTHALHMSKAMK